ncbi:MAG: GEVED domain-containing protein [Chitinophagales bacterium]|nr:GEVED domain-containing protein [Chitinophagales bacterium]MDW8427294.1 GEVED domain-containing protein [Chitinophagales bacterium]
MKTKSIFLFLLAHCLLIHASKAQYCITNLYYYGCNFGDYIGDVQLGTINQSATGCGTAGYQDFTSLSTTVEQGSTHTIKLTTGGYGLVVSLWVDFNDDYVFSTSEKLISYFNCPNPNTTYQATFIVPVSAKLGPHRMRLRGVAYPYPFPFTACSQEYYGEVHDYTLIVTAPGNMTYVSSTVIQPITDAVSAGTSDAEIIAVQVVTSGSQSPLTLTALSLNANGTTNFSGDVNQVKVYYTGSSSTFDPSVLFGSSVTMPATITGSQQLASGVNYFWVAFEVKSTATLGNYLDAECTALVINGVTYTPSVTAPAGSRQLGYCTPVATYGCWFAYIDGVQLNTLSNTGSYCNGNPDGYNNYPPMGSLTTALEAGNSYPITLTAPMFESVGMGVWIDFNSDGDFADADEFVYQSPTIFTQTITGTITIPANAPPGSRRMRVRCNDYAMVLASQYCTPFSYGETEDYTITIQPPSNMTFVSAKVTQNTELTQPGSTNQHIIGIEVVTKGVLNPFNVTSFTLTPASTTNFAADVAAVKIFYTGTSNTFSTATLFGSAPDLNQPITGNIPLAAGTNYFWVAYDIKSTATIGNVVDAACNQIVMSGAGGTKVPNPSSPAGSRQIDYCLATNTQGCYYGYIDEVIFNSLINSFSGCNANPNGYIQYAPSQFTTTVEQGQVYPILLTGGPSWDYVGFGVWMDFNHDGDFADAGEFVWSSPSYAIGQQTGYIAIPANANTGPCRMRIRSLEFATLTASNACGNIDFYYGETEDYTITILPPSPMTFISSTCVQPNTSPVTLGETNADIMRIEIITQGSLNPLSVTSFTLNDNGCTDFFGDVTQVKIYYTGSSSAFAPVNLFGSATSLNSPITGNQQLQGGVNYFWVAFDVSPNGTLGNILDVECTQIMLTNIGAQTPTITAPPQYREINYCVPSVLYGCFYGYIDGVQLNSLKNTLSGCNTNVNSYIEYAPSGSLTTQLTQGNTYTLTLEGPYWDAVGFGVWIDYNNNGSFNDAGEFVFGSPTYTYGTQTATLAIPCDPAFVGARRMRVRSSSYDVLSSSDACTELYYGETEDYIVTISAATANMSYNSSYCAQNNLSPVGVGVNDVEILSIQIVTQGCNSPLTVTSFKLNSNGTTDFANDVSQVKIYYTGQSPVFAPVNLFGAATNTSSPISGNQVLNSGTNYFWVAYDIKPTATVGNYLDASCTQIVISGVGNVTPATPSPPGNRQINYCVPTIYYGCLYGDYINNVKLNTLSNLNSGCNYNTNSYINYAPTGSLTTTLQQGVNYVISVDASYYSQGFGIWLDYNNDLDFDDPGEFIGASPSYATSYSQQFTVSMSPDAVGQRRLRLRCASYSTLTADDWCDGPTIVYYGETEDYTVTIQPAPPCTGLPSAGIVKISPAVLCGMGNATAEVYDYSPVSDLSFQWQSSTDGVTWFDISGATDPVYTSGFTVITHLRVRITCDNSGLSNFSTPATIEVGGAEAISSVNGATLCGQGYATVSASGNAEWILWYTEETGGAPVYASSSPSTYTPFVSTTQTYFVSAATGSFNTGSVGPADNSIGPVTASYTYSAMYFDVFKKCRLNGVYVYPAEAGVLSMQLTDAGWNVLKTASFVITTDQINQKTYLSLGWDLLPGSNYHLGWGYPSIDLFSNDYQGVPYDYPYVLNDVLSITQSSFGTYYYFYYYDWQIDYSELCESPRVPVTVTVTPAPQIQITTNPAQAALCANSGQSVVLTASGPYPNFLWSPPDGLNTTTGAQVNASPAQTTSYIVQASDGVCQDWDTVTVTVYSPPQISTLAIPPAICPTGTTQLVAAVPATDYQVDAIPFAPVALTAAAQTVTFTYDSYTSDLPIGFTFNFYGNNYDKFYLSNNGWLSFSPPFNSGCCEGQHLPNSTAPNNLIAFAWEDLEPAYGGLVQYQTIGTAPYRKLVVNFKDVYHYYMSDPVTVQVILYESTHVIEIHTTSMPGNPSGWWGPHTMGIENADGTKAVVVPGRNASNTWTATKEAWRFTPLAYTYDWTPPASLSDPFIANPLASPSATTVYTVTVTDPQTACVGSNSVTVQVVTSPSAGTIEALSNQFCGSGSTELTLTNYSPGATIQWQQAAVSGGPYTNIPGATSPVYNTGTLTSTTYYVAQVSCQNSATTPEFAVTIKQQPPAPQPIDGGNCGPGTVNLGAIPSGNGTLNWYFSASGNSYIGSGTPFTTPYINQTTTFWVEQAEFATPPPLTTTLYGSNIANGNMFEVTAKSDLYITGFDVVMSQFYTTDIEIYYKPGTFMGSEYNSSAWTLLGVAPNVTGKGVGLATPIPLSLHLFVPAGQTIAFYITCTNPYAYLNFLYGSQMGAVYAQDNHLQIREGTYNGYPFSFYYGPVVWNGRIRYVVPGCASPRVAVVAQIYAPQVMASAQPNVICNGETITLSVTNLGQGDFVYEWMPQLWGMNPPDGLSDTVTVTPPVTMTFTVSVTDPDAPQCDTSLTVPVTVFPTPLVFISNLQPHYYVTDPPVPLIGIPPGGSFSGPGVIGNYFYPATVGVGGPYSITYTLTDANGCTGFVTQDVFVYPMEGINDPEDLNAFIVYPNPGDGHFTLKWSQPPPQAELRIYSLLGQLLQSRRLAPDPSGQVSLNLHGLAEGTYLLELIADGKHVFRKLTVMNP